MNDNKNSQYILYDIAISKNDCPSESCVYWEVTRDQAYFDSIEYPLVSSTIRYGDEPDGMQTTIPPKPLISGEYSVAASVASIDESNFLKSYKVFQNFKLNISGERKLFCVTVMVKCNQLNALQIQS